MKTKDDADEIEITPEMIRAGVQALSEFDPRFESESDAVARIFSAMLEVAFLT